MVCAFGSLRVRYSTLELADSSDVLESSEVFAKCADPV